MNALLVDDESLARERLRSLLEHSGIDITIIGESGSATEAVHLINEMAPDLVFLDIEMPGLDGFDVISMLREPRPHIVFVTAYDQYAIKAFEVHALDYLTKPVRMERLQRCLNRILASEKPADQRASMDAVLNERPVSPLRVLTGKKGRTLHVVNVEDIIYIEAQEKELYAYTEEKRLRIEGTLRMLENRLDPGLFIRTHRSYLVNVKHICELIPWFSGTYEILLSGKRQLPVARRRVPDLKQMLGL